MKKRMALLLLTALLAGCKQDTSRLNGYVEGEYVLMTPTGSGILASLPVQRGQDVEAGADIFSLDLTSLTAARNQAVAEIAQAEATLVNAQKEFARIDPLAAKGAASQSEKDKAKAALDTAVAAEEAAKQKLIQAERLLAEAAPKAPAAGRVEDTYFRVGEYVPAGTPVVSLLPPGNVKIRFFVPQETVPRLRAGQAITLGCDGCSAPIPAKITFVANQAEYTPPVIYSVGSRDKLVFLVEAKPDAFDPQLRPGLPVDITFGGP
jgi:HlyD family secretion protein